MTTDATMKFKPIEGKCPICGTPVIDTTQTALVFSGNHIGEPWPADLPKPDLHTLECPNCDWENVVDGEPRKEVTE